MDDLALSIGRAVIDLTPLAGWGAAGMKTADSGDSFLAWVIGLIPPIIVVLGFTGLFR